MTQALGFSLQNDFTKKAKDDGLSVSRTIVKEWLKTLWLKTMKAVGDLLEEFKERFGKYPNVAQFDEGKEFYNVGVRDLLTKNNIEYLSTNSERKAAIVERFNRTLKTSMWKYFYSKGTHIRGLIYLMISRIIIIIPSIEPI